MQATKWQAAKHSHIATEKISILDRQTKQTRQTSNNKNNDSTVKQNG